MDNSPYAGNTPQLGMAFVDGARPDPLGQGFDPLRDPDDLLPHLVCAIVVGLIIFDVI